MQEKSYSLEQLAVLLDAELEGDPALKIHGIATLQSANSQQITFLNNPNYRRYLKDTQAAAVIISETDAKLCGTNKLIMANPYAGYARIAKLFEHLPEVPEGTHPTAVIDPSSQIHPSASIGPYAVIEADVVIGEKTTIGAYCSLGARSYIGANTRLWPHVILYHDIEVGDNVMIHSGAVIGSDGFGIVKDQGIWHKVPQIAGVTIGNDVEIGANTTIDRGALENTLIDDGVKLDNQIQVAHAVRIGKHTAIAGCTGIAGSVRIGKHCIIGGGVNIAGHLTIADNVSLTGAALVSKSITKADVYSSGTGGCHPNKIWRKNAARFRQLDNMAKRLRDLEKLLQISLQTSDEQH